MLTAERISVLDSFDDPLQRLLSLARFEAHRDRRSSRIIEDEAHDNVAQTFVGLSGSPTLICTCSVAKIVSP